MKSSIIASVLVALIVIAAGAGILFYTNESMNYISTEDAKVQGDISTVTSTATGTITQWNIKDNQEVKKGDVIAVVQSADPAGAAVQIVAPADGTVLQSKGAVGQVVSAGTPVAMTAPLNQLYIIANIEETDIQDVKVGSDVKVTVDAFPGTEYSGKVEEISEATSSTFSMLPSSNASGNYTKVVQKIPVKISLDSEDKLVPGLNATVKISK
ncbi:HlyD family efflux transporter periplasmic adaptor subunit [Shimazuella sp. AN120528]|uniref:HlyD family secretion protein n=1 Tax=Shimazuella soli TaxID=1892854 RepID=UPI001F1090CA|nr:HlyD family efflux transporter periplasmic adaptor subunit [Shimazuella soli]MCH5584404.1 HlyD family efflux transporter periplasmic adaptor subunit [Shimazuella soli]